MAGRALQRRRRRNPGAADWIRRNRVALIAFGVAGAAAFFWPSLEADVPQWLPLNRLTGGAKVDDTDAPEGEYLPISPVTLAAAAGVPVDVYSLARAIRSEAGSSGAAERTAVGWCIVNEARRKFGGDVTRTVTQGSSGAGYFGSQNLGGRYVATRYAPRTKDIELARGILDGSISDNTGGGTRFFNPSLQDKLVKLGTKRYTKGSEKVIAGWRADGFEPGYVPGVDPSSFIVFRYVGKGALTS